MTEASPFSFEGEEVIDFSATLPSAKLEAPEAYPRGTELTLQVRVRVRSVRIDSDKHDNLVRNHMLALDECTIIDVLTPQMRAALVAAAEAEAEMAGADSFAERSNPATNVDPDDLGPVVTDGQLTVDDVIAEQATEQSDRAF